MSRTRNWEDFLPVKETRAFDRTTLGEFHDFLRCTNQLELLIRYFEVFEYEIDPSYRNPDPDFDWLRIRQGVPDTDPPTFIRSNYVLSKYLQGQIEARGGCSVLLHQERALTWHSKDAEKEAWRVSRITDEGTLLHRSRGLPPPPRKGWLRSSDFHGQVRLIERRQEAIERLADHTYLLKAMASMGEVYMDLGQRDLLCEKDERIDASKKAVMQDVLRVMPLYALQGPPGTGKTTLVAHMLQEILREDPVAQILVTAQAHGAVDVLRNKVAGVFDPTDEILSVRLGLDSKLRNQDPEVSREALDGTVLYEVKELLARIRRQLDGSPVISEVQRQWRELIPALQIALQTGATSGPVTDLLQLVRRAANIVYCTTSAGDLETICKESLTFDWTIIEEAGKVHGFDLALPMQAGHRWLLLGDHQQLYPYRLDDFEHCIDELEQAIDYLNDQLSSTDRRLLDMDWMESWREHRKDLDFDLVKFKSDLKSRLRVFETIWLYLAGGMQGRLPNGFTTDKSIAAAAGRLKLQYRMHPDISRLISHTFYDRGIDDAVKQENLLHPLVAPECLKGKAVVWVEVPYAGDDPSYTERPYYSNPKEVAAITSFLENLQLPQEYLDALEDPDERKRTKPLEIAVLAPYNAQRSLLGKSLEKFNRRGFKLREHVSARGISRRAFTVDGFQGAQSDVVIISLTRNNDKKDPGNALGFLRRKERINVMMSRAERLLVLVGSRKFFRNQVQAVPEIAINDPYWHWWKLMKLIDQYDRDKTLGVYHYGLLTAGGNR